MDPHAKRKITIGRAQQIKTLYLREVVRVAIGRPEDDGNQVALAQRLTAKVKFLQRIAEGHLHGAVIAHEFFDGAIDQVRLATQQRQLFGVAQQRKQTISDQVDHGFVATKEQLGDRADQFVFIWAASLLFHRDECTDQVILWLAATFGDDRAQIIG